jgi:dTDP-glucose 4,6-dehydratase
MQRVILITGGAGFIGSNFTNFWSERYPEDKIIVLDKLTYAGNLENLTNLYLNPNFEVMQGDVIDASVVDSCVSRANVVVHFAAETHVTRSLFDSREFVVTDVLGTQNILSSIVRNRSTIEKYVHISSSEVYGTALESLMGEGHPLNPLSPYAAAKCGADRLVYSFIESYKIPGVIVRPFNNFGPNQHLEKLIPRLITSALTDEAMIIHGKGDSRRDFVYVKDTCEVIHEILKNDLKFEPTYHSINIGTGKSFSVLEIAKLVKANFPHSKSKIVHIEDRPGQVTRHTADNSSLSEFYDITKLTTFSDGLKQTIDWYQGNESWWKKQWSAREIEIVLPDGRKVKH